MGGDLLFVFKTDCFPAFYHFLTTFLLNWTFFAGVGKVFFFFGFFFFLMTMDGISIVVFARGIIIFTTAYAVVGS